MGTEGAERSEKMRYMPPAAYCPVGRPARPHAGKEKPLVGSPVPLAPPALPGSHPHLRQHQPPQSASLRNGGFTSQPRLTNSSP